ncbi:OLC1v1007925C1 [Oldenlandia corymbosa var. corymbosa]|uniref:OLC1v1007925C1 n=1 Tax=Oldenlandia corymbosa var. corymbosa TaxID=529605 RepID=A0AAV1DKC7_OLDCO|nr:OLC1v1007925C1 [Oldenlandia corymbosa var. corymbosa]
MENIQKELISLRPYIEEALQEGLELFEPQDLDDRVTKMIYKLEYVADSIKPARNCSNKDRGHQVPAKSSGIARASKAKIEKLVFRLLDQEKVIAKRLTTGTSQRNLVAIVGTFGLGKTTLANIVYDDPRISRHFKCRAWYYVSQTYEKRDLLLQVLGDIQRRGEKIHDMDEADLELRLQRCLSRKRYLVVLDNLWDVRAWEAIQTSFPDDGNGSRIMITNCSYDVVLRSWNKLEKKSLNDVKNYFWLPFQLLKTDEKSFEEEEEDALMEVIDRGLLIIAKRKSTGGLKSCRMHVLLDPLCLSKSEAENFSQRITLYDEPYHGIDLDREDPSSLAKYEKYRVCVHLKRKDYVDSRPLGPFARYLIYIASDDAHPKDAYNLSFIFEDFKLLRVINKCSPKLETLIVKGLSRILLPDNFWLLKSLRHAYIKGEATVDINGYRFGTSNLLDKLLKFSSPSLLYGKNAEGILRKFPNIQKLNCTFHDSLHYTETNAIQLQQNFLYHGLTWDMKKEKFRKLKFLKLDSLNIIQWNAFLYHLPKLEQLVLWNYKDLEDVPYGFSAIPTLQIIEVKWCSESLEESIKYLEESIEGLQVLISH